MSLGPPTGGSRLVFFNKLAIYIISRNPKPTLNLFIIIIFPISFSKKKTKKKKKNNNCNMKR